MQVRRHLEVLRNRLGAAAFRLESISGTVPLDSKARTGLQA